MRGRGGKLGSLLLALVFQGVAAADALALHPCPHHTALPETTQADAPPHHGHAAASHHGDDHASQHGEHGDEGPCTCVGTCQAEASSAVLPRAAEGSAWAAPAEWTVPAPATAASLPGLPPHFIPFSNGPPRAL